METTFNYERFASSPASEAPVTDFRQELSWGSLNVHQQEQIKRAVSNQVLQDIHERIKVVRSELAATIKVLSLQENGSLQRAFNSIRQLDIDIQNRRMQP